MPQQTSLFPDNYDDFFRDLKERIRSSQVKAAIASLHGSARSQSRINLALLAIGREILQRQQKEGWGTKVVGHALREPKATLGTRSKTGIPRNVRILASKLEVYALFCRSLS